MSLSPARQHRLRVQAEQAAREGGSVRHASGYDLMLLQLAEDRRRLKGVQSTVKKAEIKVELLPKYAAWAEGVLAAGGAQQDDVLMYVMLWRIDAGDYAGALEIGRHALRHGWVMPLGNRNVQTVPSVRMTQRNSDRSTSGQNGVFLMISACSGACSGATNFMLLSPEIEGGGRGFDVAVPFATPCRPCAGARSVSGCHCAVCAPAAVCLFSRHSGDRAVTPG